MGDNPKDRGNRNIANKNKYKPKPRGSVPPKVSKVILESNWDRYEAEESANKIDSSTDFAVLASAPITIGSHFQFKTDKDALEESVKCTELFNLDLNLLDRSLGTISFHIRSGIDDQVFTETQREIMVQKSKSDGYLAYLEARQIKEPPNLIFGFNEEASDCHADNKLELDMSTDSSSISETREFHKEVKTEAKSDMENWLENILDD